MKAGLVRLLGGVSIAIAFAFVVGKAEASPVPLPDAVYYNAVSMTFPNGQKDFNGGHQSGPASLHGSTTVWGGTSWDFTTSANYNVPSVFASGRAGPGIEGTSGASLTYYVSFLGAPGDILVNVHATGSTTAAGPNVINDFGHNEAAAGFWIEEYFPSNGGTGPDLARVSIESNQRSGSGPGLHTFTYNQQLTFTANAIYQVTMQAIASAYDDHASTATIDPFFTAPAGYTVQTSSGIGNSAAVTPIPAALPLLTSGLGALGLLGWRRRTNASRAA
jgi:hypothetical protein